MGNKKQIGFISTMLILLFIAGCSTGSNSRAVVSNPRPMPAPSSSESSLNDRSTWI